MQTPHMERRVAAAPGEGAKEPAASRRLSGASRLRQADWRILVVDDAPDVTEVIALLLRKEGYEVVRAHSGAEALEAARREQFNLVISDIGMPGMNGYQLAAALRALRGYEHVPMMAVTGYARYDDAQLSVCAGFDEHITKPVKPSALSSAVRRLCNAT